MGGASLLCGGGGSKGKGFFVEPTLFGDVQDDMTICKEEIFGPVLAIQKFTNLQDVAEQVNKSKYGLAAGIYTTNLDKANYLSNALRAGTIWINCYNSFDAAQPFGGYKESGSGRELGEYGLEAYTEIKAIVTKPTHKIS